jgi:deazaflavin-dependent oxidoreductase (nitroreductase family)
MPVLLLTTIGRKTGKHHTTPLVYFADGEDFVVVASNGGQGKLPNWCLNMRQNKQAHIEIGKKQLRVNAQEADPEERQRLWPHAVAGFSGYAQYQHRTPYPIPLVIFHPMA